MSNNIFTTINGIDLIVHHRTSGVIFFAKEDQLTEGLLTDFHFTEEVFAELKEYLESIIPECWKNFELKKVRNLGSWYTAYYDKALGNNGSLTILPAGIRINRPSAESNKLYQFSKARMQSFMYDLQKQFEKEI